MAGLCSAAPAGAGHQQRAATGSRDAGQAPGAAGTRQQRLFHAGRPAMWRFHRGRARGSRPRHASAPCLEAAHLAWRPAPAAQPSPASVARTSKPHRCIVAAALMRAEALQCLRCARCHELARLRCRPPAGGLGLRCAQQAVLDWPGLCLGSLELPPSPACALCGLHATCPGLTGCAVLCSPQPTARVCQACMRRSTAASTSISWPVVASWSWGNKTSWLLHGILCS